MKSDRSPSSGKDSTTIIRRMKVDLELDSQEPPRMSPCELLGESRNGTLSQKINVYKLDYRTMSYKN